MRGVASWLGVLLLIAPLHGAAPADPAPAPGSFTSWKGKNVGELLAELGKPHKIKRDGQAGTVLVYRLRFYGSEPVGETKVLWSDVGVGPTSERNERNEPGRMSGPSLVSAAGLAVVATQKARFYVDARGIVQREEYGPRKYKKGRN